MEETLSMKILTGLEEKAAQFLKDHPEFNEIELTGALGVKVKVVRFSPAPVGQHNILNPWSPYNSW